MAERANRNWRASAWGLGGALAIHSAFLALFVLTMEVARLGPETPAVQVSLVPPFLPRPTRPRARPSARIAASVEPAVQVPASKAPPHALPGPPPAPAASDAGLAKLRGLLRGVVGCSQTTLVKLTQAEKDGCRKRLEAFVDPDLQIPAPIDPEKRAWFDASLAAYHSPGHAPGVACRLPFGPKPKKKDRGPAHSLKLGPLPCYLIPPQGFLTEESGVRPP